MSRVSGRENPDRVGSNHVGNLSCSACVLEKGRGLSVPAVAPVRTTTCIVCVEKGHGCPELWGLTYRRQAYGRFLKESIALINCVISVKVFHVFICFYILCSRIVSCQLSDPVVGPLYRYACWKQEKILVMQHVSAFKVRIRITQSLCEVNGGIYKLPQHVPEGTWYESESLNPAAHGGESPGGRVAVCSVPGASPGALQIKRIELGTSRIRIDFPDVVKQGVA